MYSPTPVCCGIKSIPPRNMFSPKPGSQANPKGPPKSTLNIHKFIRNLNLSRSATMSYDWTHFAGFGIGRILPGLR